MKNNTDHTNKKGRREDILIAAERLITDGRPLSSIRVAEIAAMAGIGKSTVYEYFPTKEDLLAQAMRYSFHNELASLWASVQSVQGFHDRWLALLEAVGDFSRRSVCLLRLAAGDSAQPGVSQIFLHDLAPEFDRLTRTFLDTMIQWAREEELITATDTAYCRLILFSTLNTYMTYVGSPLSKRDEAKGREYLYTALMKALN